MMPKGSVLATFLSIIYESCLVNTNPIGLEPGATKTKHVLDRAKTVHGGSYTEKQVEGAKLVTRLTPFLFAMVPYWGIYSQISTTFQNQGCQMDLSLGSAMIPVSAVSCFDTLAILAMVPLFDQVIYPWLKKKGFPLTSLQRMGKLLLLYQYICDDYHSLSLTLSLSLSLLTLSSSLSFHFLVS